MGKVISIRQRTEITVETVVDVTVSNHGGSIVMFYPRTQAAEQWIEDNVQLESWQWLGLQFGVDPRYAGDLVAGMRDAGLEVA